MKFYLYYFYISIPKLWTMNNLKEKTVTYFQKTTRNLIKRIKKLQ